MTGLSPNGFAGSICFPGLPAAIHLAMALHLAAAAGRRGLYLATSDVELIRAAKAEGLRVLRPVED